MKVRWYMERGDTSILKSWFRFNRVCVEFRRTSWNLHEFEMLAGWISDAVLWTGLDGAEMPFCGPGWRWVVTKMEVKHRHQDLNLVEKRPRWRRETNLGAWLGVRCKSWDLAGGEMQHGLSWDSHLETWIRCNVTTSRMRLSWPGLRWDVTWIVVRCEYRDLDGRGKGEGEIRIFVI